MCCLTVARLECLTPWHLLSVCLFVFDSCRLSPRLPIYLLCCLGSDVNVSPVIGIWAPRLPLCVCLGSDADISPVIGSRAPRLPVCLCLFVCVSAELRML